MKPIRILHASDLHIALYKNHNYRSPLDRLEDINFTNDWSWNGIREKLKTPQFFFNSWWKKLSASSYEPEVLDALAEYIYKNAIRKNDGQGNLIEDSEGNLDAVILTGDLATTGEKDDILQTRKFLQGTPNEKRPYVTTDGDRSGTLAAVKIPVIFLPGNHDRLIPTRRFAWSASPAGWVPKFFNPGGTYFDDYLEDFKDELIKSVELNSPAAEGKILKVLILSADCTLRKFEDHQGIMGWIAQGKVYNDALLVLKHKTASAVENKKPNEILCVIWALHFPPDYPGMKSQSKLINEDKLIEAANESAVPVTIIAGHTHKQLDYRSPNMQNKAFCCGTTSQYEPLSKFGEQFADDLRRGNLFQVFSISADVETENAVIETEDYRYSSVGIFGSNGMDTMDANEMGWKRITYY